MLRVPGAEATVIPLDGPEITVKGLRVSFSVTRTADQEPNSGQFTIYNLSARTRALISGAVVRPPVDVLTAAVDEITGALSPYKTGAEVSGTADSLARKNGYAFVRLRAGFRPVLTTVLEGTSTSAASKPSGVDWLTTLKFTDSLATVAHAAVNRTFERGEPVFAAVQHLVRVLGLRSGIVNRATWDSLSGVAGVTVAGGNVGDLAGNIFAGGGPLSGEQYYASPYTPQGDPVAQLTQLLEVYRVRWILDEGAVYLLGPTGCLPGPPIDLVPREVPEENVDGLLVRATWNPLVRSAARVNLRSLYAPGIYYAQAVRQGGDTFGELLTEVELTSLGRIPGVY